MSSRNITFNIFYGRGRGELTDIKHVVENILYCWKFWVVGSFSLNSYRVFVLETCVMNVPLIKPSITLFIYTRTSIIIIETVRFNALVNCLVRINIKLIFLLRCVTESRAYHNAVMEYYGHLICFFCCPKIAFIFLIFRDLLFVANAINELNDFNKAVLF